MTLQIWVQMVPQDEQIQDLPGCQDPEGSDPGCQIQGMPEMALSGVFQIGSYMVSLDGP